MENVVVVVVVAVVVVVEVVVDEMVEGEDPAHISASLGKYV